MQTTRAPHLADRSPKGDRTREQLFEAALEEFRRVGVEAASIGQIAARAGTSRASFYFHYPSKKRCCSTCSGGWRPGMVERIAGAAALRDALTQLIDALIEVGGANWSRAICCATC